MKKKILIIAIGLLIAFGYVFRSQLYDFFISPDGLSIAPSEICLKNETEIELIAELDTFVGAKIETLLYAGERVCAPSPNEQVVGLIKVGAADAGGYSCELKMTKFDEARLVRIDDTGNCQWGE